MNRFQKMGGVAALIYAATYVVGAALMFTLLAPGFAEDIEPVQKVAFFADNQAITYIWNLFSYAVAGAFLVVLALALYNRLKAASPAMVQTATAFRLIWAGLVIAAGTVFITGLGTVVDLFGKDLAQAAAFWLAIESVFDGLEGANVILGGLESRRVGCRNSSRTSSRFLSAIRPATSGPCAFPRLNRQAQAQS